MSAWVFFILILALLPVVILSLPLTFKGGGCLGMEEQQLEARLAWGWGLLTATAGLNGSKKSFGIRLAGIALPVSRKKKAAVRAKKPVKKTGRRGKRHGFSFSAVSTVLSRQFLAIVLAYLKRIFGSCRLRLRLSGVYGADDPALTGLLAGLAAALRSEHFSSGLEADFSGPVLDIDIEISGRIIPIAIIGLTIRLLLAGPVRKLWWGQLKNKFIRRKQKEVAQYV